MRLPTAALTLVLAACSAGSLDLTTRDPSKRQLRNYNYDPSAILVEKSSFQLSDDSVGKWAEAGFEIYRRGRPDANPLDQIIFAPKTHDLIRQIRATSGNPANNWQPCVLEIRATAAAIAPSAAGHERWEVRAPNVIQNAGPQPCAANQSDFIFEIDRDAGSATILFDEKSGTYTRTSVAYDSSWKDVSASGAPPPLVKPTAYVHGPDVLVWGRTEAGGGFSGAVYDLDKDSWQTMANAAVPLPVYAYRSVWTGSRMILITGAGGATYDPDKNAWTPLSKTGAPLFDGGSVPGAFEVAYGDGKVYVFGVAFNGGGAPYPLGAIYDVQADSWQSITTKGAPLLDTTTELVWTGVELIVWSKLPTQRAFYYPETDTWVPVTLPSTAEDAGAARLVWTGSQALAVSIDGGAVDLYDRGKGAWESTYALADLPRRSGFVGWSDRRVFAFGGPEPASSDTATTSGSAAPTLFKTGGFLFDPTTRAAALIPAGPSAPEGRGDPAVAKTGARIFVWGGCGRDFSGTCQAYKADGKVVTLQP